MVVIYHYIDIVELRCYAWTPISDLGLKQLCMILDQTLIHSPREFGVSYMLLVQLWSARHQPCVWVTVKCSYSYRQHAACSIKAAQVLKYGCGSRLELLPRQAHSPWEALHDSSHAILSWPMFSLNTDGQKHKTLNFAGHRGVLSRWKMLIFVRRHNILWMAVNANSYSAGRKKAVRGAHVRQKC